MQHTCSHTQRTHGHTATVTRTHTTQGQVLLLLDPPWRHVRTTRTMHVHKPSGPSVCNFSNRAAVAVGVVPAFSFNSNVVSTLEPRRAATTAASRCSSLKARATGSVEWITPERKFEHALATAWRAPSRSTSGIFDRALAWAMSRLLRRRCPGCRRPAASSCCPAVLFKKWRPRAQHAELSVDVARLKPSNVGWLLQVRKACNFTTDTVGRVPGISAGRTTAIHIHRFDTPSTTFACAPPVHAQTGHTSYIRPSAMFRLTCHTTGFVWAHESGCWTPMTVFC